VMMFIHTWRAHKQSSHACANNVFSQSNILADLKNMLDLVHHSFFVLKERKRHNKQQSTISYYTYLLYLFITGNIERFTSSRG
jgi:hypothetical protein